MGDNYVFRGASDDVWSDPGDWTDTTTGATPAASAPGPADTATLPVLGTNYTIIAGPGAAASLSVLGLYGLTGGYQFGSLTIGNATTAGTLDLEAAAVVNAAGVTITSGTLQVSGAGAALADSGAVTIGSGALVLLDHATARLGSLSLAEPTFATGNTASFAAGNSGVTIDGTAAIEVGAAGGAAPGVLTIDAGNTVAGYGQILPNIVNNGVLEASGGQLQLGNVLNTQSGIYTQVGSVSGSGRLQIDAGAKLSLFANTAEPILFAGSNGSLVFDTAQLPAITGTITGFAEGDQITDGFDVVLGYFITPVYSQTGPGMGTLALYSHGSLLTNLTLAGNYAGDTFISVFGGGLYLTVEVLSSPAVAAPVTAGSATLANTGSVFQRVSGVGSAGSLTITGLEAVTGQLSVGSVTVGAPSSAPSADQLVITPGASITVGSLTLNSRATIGVEGAGSSFIVNGALSETNGGVISALGGGNVQIASVAPGLFNLELDVDTTSRIEIGTLGNATAGALTIDPGQTVDISQDTLVTKIVNNGTLTQAQSNFFNAPQNITGSGTIRLGTGGTANVGNTTNTIQFTGPETLQIGSGGSLATQVTGTITGFAPGDTIAVLQLVTRAAYTATGPNIGTLTLYDDQVAVDQLTLAGNYSGYTFVTTGTNTASITVLPTPATSTLVPSPGLAGHSFTFQSATGGDWDNPANWFDNTTGATALVSPGRLDSATVGGSGQRIISGAAQVSSLTVTGSTVVTGAIAAGTITMSNDVLVQPGATLTAANVVSNGGVLQVSGAGATATVTGTLGPAGPASLSAVDGGVIRIAATAASLSYNIDDHSSIEIGAVGGAATGALTVDAGATLQGSAGGQGHTIDAGTIAAIGGNPVLEEVGGRGMLEIGSGATLQVRSATPDIHFDSASGTLEVFYTRLFYPVVTSSNAGTASGPPTGFNVTGTISGFTVGDTIHFAADDLVGPDAAFPTIAPSGTPLTITSAAYRQTAPGLGQLVLSTNGVTAGTLTLAGNYSGDTFLLNQSGREAVVTLAPSPAPFVQVGASFQKLSGAGVFSQTGTAATLNLGSFAQGSGPVTAGFGVLATGAGATDTLSGTVQAAGPSAFSTAGFGSFAGLAAGQADLIPSVTLNTSNPGTFSETITLSPTDTNPAASTASLPAQTLTITGTVVPTGGGAGDVHMATFDGLH
ncbi:MAG: hypothetical protein NVSMB18_01800 [Acetobacteraceae bacterium]